MTTPKYRASQVAPVVRNSPANAGDIKEAGSIPRSEISSGGGMANHSSILAWRIPWTEEPGGLQSTGSQRIRHDWATNTFHFQRVDEWRPVRRQARGGPWIIRYSEPEEKWEHWKAAWGPCGVLVGQILRLMENLCRQDYVCILHLRQWWIYCLW